MPCQGWRGVTTGNGAARTVRKALMGFASSKTLQVHDERMINHTFDPGCRVCLHRKDLNQALQSARELGISLLNTATCQDLFNSCAANGGGDDDRSGMVKALERMTNHKIG